MRPLSTTRRNADRGAFTLIELLVVIAIIAILSALTMAAVQRVRQRGQDVQARADISQLETALGQFKAKFGVYPPCFGGGTGSSFRLATTYTGALAGSPEQVILKQMFPRMSDTDNGLRSTSNAVIPASAPILLDPNQCLVFFLNGGPLTNYQGFATRADQPFQPPTGTAASSTRLNNGPFFEFKTEKLVLPSNVLIELSSMKKPDGTLYPNGDGGGKRFTGDAAGQGNDFPWFVDPWGNPYLYFASNQGNDYPFGASATSIKAFNGILSFKENGTRYINPRGVQIISSGRNRIFGGGGDRSGAASAGQGTYALNKEGGDDIANFQQTPLGVND